MIVQLMSLLGTTLVLSAYFAVAYTGKKATTPLVTYLNVLGSILLLLTACALFNVGFIFLNVAWIGIGILSYRKARNVRPDEIARANG